MSVTSHALVALSGALGAAMRVSLAERGFVLGPNKFSRGMRGPYPIHSAACDFDTGLAA